MSTPDPEQSSSKLERAKLARAVLVFQGKLLLEALRDLVLSPISLVAAAADLVQGKVRHFPAVLKSWRKTDDFIDLWSAVEPDRPAEGLDRLIAQVENELRQRAARGENLAQLRGWVERQLAAARSGRTAPGQANPAEAPLPEMPPPPTDLPGKPKD